MNSLSKRLEQLERANQPGETNPLKDMPLTDFMVRLEADLELPPGELPRSPEEAAARGYESLAAATADALGMTYQEFRRFVETGEYHSKTPLNTL